MAKPREKNAKKPGSSGFVTIQFHWYEPGKGWQSTQPVKKVFRTVITPIARRPRRAAIGKPDSRRVA
jgi:hypothetical protein